MPLRRAIAWRRKLNTETPGHLLGVLEAEEQAPGGPLVGGQRGDVLARQQDPAGGDLVDRVAEQRVGQRRLPGAVRAHQRVELARADGQGHAAQDLAVVDA